MIDFHTLRSDIKHQLLAQAQRLDVSDDSMSWAWLARAFASDGTTNNPPLQQVLNQARRWLMQADSWQQERNLSSIGLFLSLLIKDDPDVGQTYQQHIDTQIQQLYHQRSGRYAKLNNPDFAFGIAHLGKSYLAEDLQKLLRERFARMAQAENLRLAALFAAAAHILGAAVRPLAFDVSSLSAHEIIPLIWLAEQYPNLIDGDSRRLGIWEAYERVKDGIILDDRSDHIGALHQTSPTDLAMLYEAVVSKTTQHDFNALFNNFPWHPAIRRAAGSLFIKGEYVSAVFEAAKQFIDAVKQAASNPTDASGKPLDGGPLITYCFQSKPPRLKFTSLRDQTEQNEHRGLALIAEGIVAALRNPKGHLPGSTIALTPEEALEQLAIISYILRRIDTARPESL